MSEFRIEKDSMGDVKVPANAYYGAQTQRAVENFPISGWTLPPALIHAMGWVKHACAVANRDLGKLTGTGKNPLSDEQVEALLNAAIEVREGKFDGEFPIDVFQTGSGTSSNMNVNEVISNRAIEILGGDRFDQKKPVHPNDHVNMGQSTNDTFPTAIHVAVAMQIENNLLPALEMLHESLAKKAMEWDKIIKIGRTHLMDATPLRLGQEFGGFARQIELSIERARVAQDAVLELPVGGTAVGTGINTHPEFSKRVAAELASGTGIPFIEAINHFEANAQRDGLVQCHGILKTIANTLFNVSNNIRWLGSGPRCGFFEVVLPDRQPGSSIMPGKVNPVMCESMMQVCARVMGNDGAITMSGAAGGNFQLNIMMPVMGQTTLESIHLLASSCRAFVEFCSDGLEANEEACNASVEQSLSMCTSLNPLIGYDKAAKMAKDAFKSGKTIRELAKEQGEIAEPDLNKALDPWRMTFPHE
ncbi:class II fumarate hydratase [Blastopirellula marina]|uniref:Fumarate hydratase class II n=1 Tax=Blastopirellula marina TaxID=124 RepID=A0A2S8GUF9_9BACT|nr:class II fumarate hydratase [Blastopirellula marina]PQO35567.1 aspartate ammonia-lyase [Blastopirellula marina]PQO48075.1 aspartate ammonia-lyase [Blastopirellula marina]PTL44206.1 class II fumarate hydratase [Blastopirellula marina]